MAELYAPTARMIQIIGSQSYIGKFIEKEVTQFIREECGKLPQLNRTMDVDLKAIATNGSRQDIAKVKHAS
jgi:hypothetical protein